MYSRVYVEITNICNRSCSFCHGHQRMPRQMSEAEFGHILCALAGQTGYLYYHLMGEPLTHPFLPRFLEMAAARGFRSVITTNGTLLKQRGEELLRAPLHKISISLHSFEQGDESAYTRYLSEVCAFADAASRAGVITVLRLWNRGHDAGKNDDIYRYLRAHFTDGEWAVNTRGERIRDKLHLEWGDRFAWPDTHAPVQGDEVVCYGLLDHFGILCDGSVVPCCMDAEGAITLGNIFEQPVEEILSSERAQNIVRGFSERRAAEELCRRCGYATRFL